MPSAYLPVLIYAGVQLALVTLYGDIVQVRLADNVPIEALGLICTLHCPWRSWHIYESIK